MLAGTRLTMTMRLAKKGRDGPAFMANSPILICPWVFQGGKDPKMFPQQNWAATGHWEWGARGLPNGEQEVYPVGNKRSTQQGANGLPKGVLCRQGEQGQKFQQQGRGGVLLSTLPRKISAKSAVGWNARGDILQAHHFSLI